MASVEEARSVHLRASATSLRLRHLPASIFHLTAAVSNFDQGVSNVRSKHFTARTRRGSKDTSEERKQSIQRTGKAWGRSPTPRAGQRAGVPGRSVSAASSSGG